MCSYCDIKLNKLGLIVILKLKAFAKTCHIQASQPGLGIDFKVSEVP